VEDVFVSALIVGGIVLVDEAEVEVGDLNL
jgi:hypothetical protein